MKIKSITNNGIQPTWDIEVPDGHEYLMSNGCVSHNTAQILGNNEAIEPFTSNLYTRRTLGGEFVVINKHLVNDLLKIGLWNDDIKNKIIMENGSVQNIPEIPQNLKDLYKTVWEIKQKTILEMAADRGAYICQSQSLNIHIQDVNFGKLTSMHFHAWKLGLKTGMYYLRTKAAADAIKFTVEKQAEVQIEQTAVVRESEMQYAVNTAQAAASFSTDDTQNRSDMACSLDNPEACEACGS